MDGYQIDGNGAFRLEFGVFDHMDESGDTLHVQYRDRLKIAEACDRAGFYAYHLAEHHGTPHGAAPSPNLFLAAVAGRTTKLRVSPLVMLLNLYHPLRAFEEICMLDQMSGGRVDLGIGRGASPIELAFFGISQEVAQDRYREAAEIVMQAMRTESLSHSGRHFQLENVPITLSPYQRPHPPLWYGTTKPDTAAWAADQSMNIACIGSVASIRTITDAYKERWNSKPQSKPMPLLGMVRHIVVAETDGDARTLAEPAYARWYKTLTHLNRVRALPIPRTLPESFDHACAEGHAITGSISTVRDALIQQTMEAGATYLMCHIAFGDLPVTATLETVAALKSEIMPASQAVQHEAARHRQVCN